MIQNIKTKLTSNANTRSIKTSKPPLPQEKENSKKKILFALGMLGIAGAAGLGIALKKGRKPISLVNLNPENGNGCKPVSLADINFEKGRALLKKNGQNYTGTIIHKTKDNAAVSLTYSDSILKEAKKINPDNTIAYVKKYTEEGNKEITSIFKPNIDGDLEQVRTSIIGNDFIRINGEGETIEKYFRKFDDKWRRLDQFIDTKNSNPQWYYKGANEGCAYYLQSGMDVNRFLRSGEFYNPGFIDKKIPLNVPDDDRKYFEPVIKKAKSDNRAVIDMIDSIDDFAESSTLQKPLTVYRDAPSSWMQEAKNGILSDKAFVSTSIKRNASMEGMIASRHKPYSTYEIHLPVGTQYGDLTYTSEKEVLLPRNAKFIVLGGNSLEYAPWYPW